MEWTTRKPTEKGWYWCKPVGVEEYDAATQIVYVQTFMDDPDSNDLLFAMEVGESENYALERYSEWYGPLKAASE